MKESEFERAHFQWDYFSNARYDYREKIHINENNQTSKAKYRTKAVSSPLPPISVSSESWQMRERERAAKYVTLRF